MKLSLTIDSNPLDIELDEVVAGLLGVRLGLPPAPWPPCRRRSPDI